MEDEFLIVKTHINLYLSDKIARLELRDRLLSHMPERSPQSDAYLLWGTALKHVEIFELAVWNESELRHSLNQLVTSFETGTGTAITDMVLDQRWWSGPAPIDKSLPSVRSDRHTTKSKSRIAEEFEE